jgi:hypothetical protein
MAHKHVTLSVVKPTASSHLLAKKKKGDGKRAPVKRVKAEKTWSEVIKHHVGRGASWLWDRAWRHMFGGTVKQVQALQVRLKASRSIDWQYLSKNSKEKDEPVDSDTTKLLLQEVKLLRAAVRSAVGFRATRITLTIPFQLTATVTTGVVNTAVSAVPGTSTEFSSLAALFDEYKCVSGEVHFVNFIRSSYAIGVTGSTLNTSVLALVYDTDSTALTSVQDATVYMNHKLYRLGQQSGSVTAVKENLDHFAFHVPPGVGVSTVTPIVEEGQWVPVSNTTSSFGFVKSYCVATEVVALAVVSGYMTLHCEFRARQ